MRRARRRPASALVLFVVLLQAVAAGPPTCPSAVGGHREAHEGHPEGSGEHRGLTSHIDVPAASTFDASSNTARNPQTCVSAVHCGFNLAEAISPASNAPPDERAAERAGLTWFAHGLLLPHDTPPPRA